MSDYQLKAEFLASFQTYVDDDRDIRLETLKRMLKEPVEKLLLMMPHDLAALMTHAVYVDPKDEYAHQLMDAYEDWMEDRDRAEDGGLNPDEVAFTTDMSGAPFMFDKNIEGLGDFLNSASRVEGGNAYLIKIFVCLMWAHKIPEIKANLWRPGR